MNLKNDENVCLHLQWGDRIHEMINSNLFLNYRVSSIRSSRRMLWQWNEMKWRMEEFRRNNLIIEKTGSEDSKWSELKWIEEICLPRKLLRLLGFSLAAQNRNNQSLREPRMLDAKRRSTKTRATSHCMSLSHAGVNRILTAAKCVVEMCNINHDTPLHIACAMGLENSRNFCWCHANSESSRWQTEWYCKET